MTPSICDCCGVSVLGQSLAIITHWSGFRSFTNESEAGVDLSFSRTLYKRATLTTAGWNRVLQYGDLLPASPFPSTMSTGIWPGSGGGTGANQATQSVISPVLKRYTIRPYVGAPFDVDCVLSDPVPESRFADMYAAMLGKYSTTLFTPSDGVKHAEYLFNGSVLIQSSLGYSTDNDISGQWASGYVSNAGTIGVPDTGAPPMRVQNHSLAVVWKQRDRIAQWCGLTSRTRLANHLQFPYITTAANFEQEIRCEIRSETSGTMDAPPAFDSAQIDYLSADRAQIRGVVGLVYFDPRRDELAGGISLVSRLAIGWPGGGCCSNPFV